MLNTNNFITSDTTSVVSFFKICSVKVPLTSTLEHCLPLWTTGALPNKFREFIFKFYNKKLGLNTRISALVETLVSVPSANLKVERIQMNHFLSFF